MLTQINVLNADKIATESETASLKGQINAMTAKNEEAMELVKTLYGTNSGLVVKNNKLEERIRSLELQAKKSREEAEDTCQSNNALTWEKVDLTTRNRKLEGDVKRLELDVKKGLDEAKHISESFDVYRKRVRNLGNEH
jgi:chromosome segregation ATPase